MTGSAVSAVAWAGLANHFISPTCAFSTLPFFTKLHTDLLVSSVFIGSMALVGLNCLLLWKRNLSAISHVFPT